MIIVAAEHAFPHQLARSGNVVRGESRSRVVSGVAVVPAGWGYWHGLEWWRTAAWIAAPTTPVGNALWAGQIPVGTYVGGSMAAATLVALLLGW